MRALLILVALSCGNSRPDPETPETPGEIHAVTAVVVTNHCAALTKKDQRAAEITMNRLVERCTEVPHGVRTFGVVLLPGGGLQFTGHADAGETEVPICVVSRLLTHKVKLSAPCVIDIRLEQTQMHAQ